MNTNGTMMHFELEDQLESECGPPLRRQTPRMMVRPRPAPVPTALAPGQEKALLALVPLIQRSPFSADIPVSNALAIMRSIAQFHNIPARLGWTILDHECPATLKKGFNHHDGVMQTTSGSRANNIPRLHRALKLTLLGQPLDDPTPDPDLTKTLLAEFSQRLAVQIATGLQELKQSLQAFSGYVALAFVGYNAGRGSASHIATQGKYKMRPAGSTDLQWEQICRRGAILLHQSPAALSIETGMWRCDKNIPAWYQEIRVRDGQSQLLLISYQYLRSIKACIHAEKPSIACNTENHGVRQPGLGELKCRNTRQGALDKLYQPSKLRPQFYQVVRDDLLPITEDNLPLKILSDGRLSKD